VLVLGRRVPAERELPELDEQELVKPLPAVVVEVDAGSRDDLSDEGVGVIYVVAPVVLHWGVIVLFNSVAQNASAQTREQKGSTS